MGYLHQYGWLLAVFLIAVIFLYREGLIFPEREINQSCMGFDTLVYVTHHISMKGTFSITLKNQGIEPITIRRILVEWGDVKGEWRGKKTVSIDDHREVSFGGMDLGHHAGYVYRLNVAISYERGMLANRTDSAICVGKIMRTDRVY
tara:strand:- start:53 stop:493 length:441 start_codon:yes stop_codon:yes gene_type:complete